MNNYIQRGDVLTVAAPSGGVSSGDGVLIGSLFGVATADADEAADLELAIAGVFDLTKIGSQAWTVGAAVYWDDANSRCTTSAGGNVRIGVAVAAVGSGAGATTGRVRLDGAGVAGVEGVATGYKVARGQHTTVDENDTVVTGLATVVSVVAQLDDDPVDGAMHVTSSIGDQAGAPAAGSILIKTWKSTDGDASLVAASTFSKKVNWIAIGT